MAFEGKKIRLGITVKPHFRWYHQESNRGHKDFQSFALPTELWHHGLVILTAQS